MPTIRISIAENGEQKTFRKKETLISFLEEEKEYWQNFFNDKSPSTNISTSTNTIKNNLNGNIVSAIQLANKLDDDYSNVGDIQTDINNLYVHHSLIYSKSPFANFIFEESDNVLAIYLVGSYLKDGFANSLYSNTGSIHGNLRSVINEILNYMSTATVLRTMFERGYEDNLNSEKESLTLLRNNWDDVINNEIDKTVTQENRFSQLESRTKECQDDTSDLFIKQKRRFAKFMNNSKKRMKEFEDFYEKELALKSAVTYWRNKKYISYVTALILLIVLCLTGVATVNYLFELSNTIGDNLKNISLVKESSGTSGFINNIKYLPILHFLVISTFTIWGLRILVKIFLSKLHTADNASEREMFIKSYLALLNEHEGSITDEKDRQLILQSIFRPSSNGLINDEGPKVTDIINSIKGK